MNIQTKSLTERIDKAAERQKKALLALAQRRDEALKEASAIENQIRELAGFKTVVAAGARAPRATSTATRKERDLPRGVLTLAICEVIKANKGHRKGLHFSEIAEKVKQNPQLMNVPNIENRVRNVLNTNKQRFNRVGKSTFRINEAPSGALFERLQEGEETAANATATPEAAVAA